MSFKFPYAKHLLNDEVDFELKVRNYAEQLKLELEAKQDFLQKLYHEDSQEKREFQSIYTIEQDYDFILSRVTSIEIALGNKKDPRSISRLKYYYLRAKNSKVSEQTNYLRETLVNDIREILAKQGVQVQRVTETVQGAQTGLNPEEGAAAQCSEQDQLLDLGQGNMLGTMANTGRNPITSNEDQERLDITFGDLENISPIRNNPASIGAIPKVASKKMVQNTIPRANVFEEPPEQLRARVCEMEQGMEGMRKLVSKLIDRLETVNLTALRDQKLNWRNPQDNQDMPVSANRAQIHPFVVPPFGSGMGASNVPRYSVSNYPPQPRNSETQNAPLLRTDCNFLPRNNINYTPHAPMYIREQNLLPPNDDDDSEESDSNGNSRVQVGNVRDRGNQYDRRIEKWNLFFSGDSKSITLEDFIYKARMLAKMNTISDNKLLSHIHLLLRGDAADWFFTYYESDWDWFTFEARIRFRFGNPNQDQGNRQRIYDRRQQRGETFIAFVSEIERMNKLLTKPLSKRRKFEVVWENMQQRYRSKLACFAINNLDELIGLCHRIDASDPSLHPVGTRHVINNLEADQHESESEEELNVIDRRQQQQTESRSWRAQERPRERSGQGARAAGPPETTRLPLCWNCRQHGHFWRECRAEKTTFCYVCGNPGKISSTCDVHPRRSVPARPSQTAHNQGN